MKKGLVFTLTAMLAAGCSDATLAPRAASNIDSTIEGGGATAALTGTDTLRFQFVIDPSRTITYNLELALESARRLQGHPVHRDTLTFWSDLISEARQRHARNEGAEDFDIHRLIAELETVVIERRAGL